MPSPVPGRYALPGLAWPGFIQPGEPPVVTLHPGSASLSGSGTLAAVSPAVIVSGSAALSGSGSLAGTGQKAVPGTAVLGGQGTVSAAGQKQSPGAAALSGQGSLYSVALPTVPGRAVPTGSGTMRAAAYRTVPAQVAASAAALLGAQGSAGSSFHGSAAAVLTCSSLSARIVMATDTMFPANELGIYGTAEAETTVIVPGVIDGIYA